MIATLLLLLAGTAWAQAVFEDRPPVPSAGLATEGGPGALWIDPAHLAFDPDPRWGVFVAMPSAGAPLDAAATAGVGGFGLGLRHRGRIDAPGTWALDYATSLKLPARLAMGLGLHWHLVPGSRNHVSTDLGLAWRPLSWFGLSAVAWDVGAPDPVGLRPARSGAGIALRPLRDTLLLGLDLIRTFDPDAPDDLIRATTRLRAREGLYVRAGADSRGTVGLGFEIFFQGSGGGASWIGREPAGDTLGVAWVGSGEPGESLVHRGRRVPVLRLDQVPPYQPRGGLLGPSGPSWLEVLEALRRAEEDRSVGGLVVVLGTSPTSWARYQELRARIEALVARGKPVLAYLSGSPSNGSLYVASAASRVVAHPAATLDLVGVSMQLTYLRGLLDLVGVEPQFVRRDEYKAAVEQFTRSGPSEAQQLQVDALLDDVFEELVAGIARGRTLDPDAVRALIDGGPYPAEEARAHGLVDQVAYPDEVEGLLEKLVGSSPKTRPLEDVPVPRSGWVAPAQIAIVYVEGPIVSGSSTPGGLLGTRTAGSRTIVQALEQAAQSPRIRAVVIRVDSPGGSAFASDEIWRAVAKVRERGKPVVVSMGGLAASGGYYVACGADAIWAEPGTITGSIGVFSGKFALGGLYERVGLGTATFARGRNADIYAPTAWDPVQRSRMQQLVDATYTQFKQRVAAGRPLDEDGVEEVARGRIWSGRRAADVGLVDGLGGLEDAIADARRRAGIPERREVALTTLPAGSRVPEIVSPGLAARIRPVLAAMGVGPRPTLADTLPGPILSAAYAPFVVWALQGDETPWMTSPWALEIDTR